MSLTLNDLLQFAWRTVRQPRRSAREIMGVDMARGSRWEALILVVVVSVIVAQVSVALFTDGVTAALVPLLNTPVLTTFIQLTILVLMVFAIYWIGRAMGGQGRFEDGILLIAWLQFIMLCLQIVQSLSLLLIPGFAGLISAAGFILFFWLLTNFTAEMHGFKSLTQVFIMVVVSLLGIAFGMSMILAMIGIAIPGN